MHPYIKKVLEFISSLSPSAELLTVAFEKLKSSATILHENLTTEITYECQKFARAKVDTASHGLNELSLSMLLLAIL